MTQIYSNLNTIPREATDAYFSDFFKGTGMVSENEFSAVFAFFNNRAANRSTAQFMSAVLINSARAQNLSVMGVVDQFKTMDQQQTDEYIAYFMNMSRYPTSALGASNVPPVSKYVSRAILA